MVALYGWQCLHVVPSYGYFLSYVAGVPRIRQGGRLRLASPWPSDVAVPLGPLPFDVADDRLYALAPPVWFERARAYAIPPPTVAVAELKEIEAVGKTLRINGRPFVRCASEEQTELVAELLTDLLRLDEKQRVKALRSYFSRSVSVDKHDDRLVEFHKATRLVTVCCCTLFLLIFVYLPINYWFFFGRHTWAVAAPFLVVVYALTLTAFYRAHRRLFPTSTRSRWRAMLEIALFPPALMRSTDVIARQALCRIHPLAVAFRLTERGEFLDLLRREFARLEYPIWRGDPQQDTEGRRRALALQRDSLEELVEAAGASLAEILTPSSKQSADAGGYCPACLAEFRIGVASCAECRVPTIPFEERS